MFIHDADVAGKFQWIVKSNHLVHFLVAILESIDGHIINVSIYFLLLFMSV